MREDMMQCVVCALCVSVRGWSGSSSGVAVSERSVVRYIQYSTSRCIYVRRRIQPPNCRPGPRGCFWPAARMLTKPEPTNLPMDSLGYFSR